MQCVHNIVISAVLCMTNCSITITPVHVLVYVHLSISLCNNVSLMMLFVSVYIWNLCWVYFVPIWTIPVMCITKFYELSFYFVGLCGRVYATQTRQRHAADTYHVRSNADEYPAQSTVHCQILTCSLWAMKLNWLENTYSHPLFPGGGAISIS